MHGGWYKLLLSRIVTSYWPVVIAAWIIIALTLRSAAPRWEDIAADGDLAFLPSTVPSAIGQRAVEAAFPGSLSRSQLVFVIANQQQPLSNGELALALDMTRRLHWMAAKTAWEKMEASDGLNLISAKPSSLPSPTDPSQTSSQTNSGSPNSTSQPAVEFAQMRPSVYADIAFYNLTQVLEIEEALVSYFAAEELPFERLAEAYQMRGVLGKRMGEEESAAVDLATAELLRAQPNLLDARVPEWAGAIRDVWSWRVGFIGHKLGSDNPQARLVSVQLNSEFTATANIDVLNGMEELVRQLRKQYADRIDANLEIEVSGSAAVGADMLRAAASGVRKTEIVTIILVLTILAIVYRAPFLVAIPLTSIALSLYVATSVIALLARDPGVPSSSGLGVFTTTRIFIVVLLFGAGTDFCLFFLARNRELLQSKLVRTRKQLHRIVASGWRSVHDALVASACTTIVGLALMWFSRFEKFQFSGPVIAVSLAVTLTVCLTFTPALLSGLGRVAFWPLLRKSPLRTSASRGATDQSPGHESSLENAPRRLWGRVAQVIVSRPAAALCVTTSLLAIPAIYGVSCLGSVTYDLTEELSESAPSRRGARLITNFFPASDGSPITVLLSRTEPFQDDESLREACSELSALLYADGVDSVRCLTDPLGDYPPGKRMGLFEQDSWRRWGLIGHRLTQERFVSSVGSLSQRVAKFDVILKDNPFSLEAGATLSRLNEILADSTSLQDSAWYGANVAVSGTTVGITDLRSVTQADQQRIQILVTLGVWLVLIVMLRQIVLSTYLIFTVLLSYFTTLGLTYWAFNTLYGAAYSGLDWKVPLFLFVILVAVGQDYNVYLVTRIFEEARKAGPTEAVRRALQMTGGIITSCGLVMAGTFIAMTSPAVIHWLGTIAPAGWIDTSAPVLRGITELGFALALGVLLDTLIVRSILVPAFIVLWKGRTTSSPIPTTKLNN